VTSVAFEMSVVSPRPERASRPTGMRNDSGFAALVDDEIRPEPKPAVQTQVQPRDPVKPAGQAESEPLGATTPNEAAPDAGEPAPPSTGSASALNDLALASQEAAPDGTAATPEAPAQASTPAPEDSAMSSEEASSANETDPAEAVEGLPDEALAAIANQIVTENPPAATPALASAALAAAPAAPVAAPAAPAQALPEPPLAGAPQQGRSAPVVPAVTQAPAGSVTPATAATIAAAPGQGAAIAPPIKAPAAAAAEPSDQASAETPEIAQARSGPAGTQIPQAAQPDVQNQTKQNQPKQSQSPGQAVPARPDTGADTLGLQPDVLVGSDDPGARAKHALDPILQLAAPAPAHAASTQAATPQAAPVSAAQPVPVNALAIEIASQARAGNSRFEIRLDPPELGRIDVRLDIDRDGNVTSRLVIERSDTYDLLRRDQSTLERALQQAGLKTSDNALEFSLRDQGFAQQRDADDRPRGTTALIQDSDVPPSEAASGYARLLGARGGIDIRV
jgi:flagellar hook-length control protein FliK